jgi:ketosteroid isomerase-like protein
VTDTNVDVARGAFEHYRTQNRAAADRLYADDFTFTSPQDDHIDKAAFFERCFPTADRFRRQELLSVTPAGDDLVLIYYEYELQSGETYRNMEAITVRDGLIHDVQVFFGGQVTPPS